MIVVSTIIVSLDLDKIGLLTDFRRVVKQETVYKIVRLPEALAVQKDGKTFMIDASSIPKNTLDKLENKEGKEFILKGDEVYFK